MTPPPDPVRELGALLRGKTVLLGIGNPILEDDGVGPYFVSLCRATPERIPLDCGEAPENYLGRAVREAPDCILLVDAVDFGGEAGEARLLDPREFLSRGVSTHDLSLKLAARFFEAETTARVALLAFQPRATRLGFALSDELKGSARRIARALGLLSGEGGAPIAPPF
ncbi:MAG: hydrogenase 3 maturation endopeptidase HyCI [Planctomycetota bacterium]